jgi:ubiquitin C-terminal hydrolase
MRSFLFFLQESENRTKLNALIQFPVKGLDMRRHLERSDNNELFREYDDCVYDLYAVCNHTGNLQGGHYTGE